VATHHFGGVLESIYPRIAAPVIIPESRIKDPEVEKACIIATYRRKLSIGQLSLKLLDCMG
jgi:hypothetical protein